ncbi:hypothetical protein [Phaffia rhodozyma]|uniref:Uncharacterized protein n=1 Tax=Phaffia rhodozyma TaxID=264483 RepID=A0A0F7ST79_PHARH|nr:hypothetical protein [Phaffia rhodozyma]
MTDQEIHSSILKPTSEPRNSSKRPLSTPTRILQKRCYSLLKLELAGIEPASRELHRAALATELQPSMMTCGFQFPTIIPWQAPLQCRWTAFFAQIWYWYRKLALSRTTSQSNLSNTMLPACSGVSRC